jgi:magnesium transporter
MDIRVVTDEGVSEHTADELPVLLKSDCHLVWVDIPHCDDEAVRVLADVFDFHPRAIQDCVQRNRVSKMHVYSDHVFVVLHAPEGGHRGHVHYVELDQFIGHRYLVTVHGPVNPAVAPSIPARETGEVLTRLLAGRLHPGSPFELSHAIVTALARNQETYIEAVTGDVWKLEQLVTAGQVDEPEEFLNRLYRARHGLLAVRTMAALSHANYVSVAAMRINADGRRFVDDDASHFDRVRRIADGQREYLQGVIEFYQTVNSIKATLVAQTQNEEVQRLTEASYTQNEEVKKISAWAAIAFAPTLVGTVYGMNFDHMPELHWALGYPAALGLMALTSIALYALFRRRNWI